MMGSLVSARAIKVLAFEPAQFDQSMEVSVMRRLFVSFVILLIFCCVAGGLAQNQPYTPEKGSPERKAIVDALRVPVERKLRQEVIFKIDHLKVMNGWAFLL